MNLKYSLIIRWSDEDHCYIAWVPEFGPAAKVHGDSYETAAKAGREVIESILEMPVGDRPPLAAPWVYDASHDDARIGKAVVPDDSAYKSARKSSAVA